MTRAGSRCACARHTTAAARSLNRGAVDIALRWLAKAPVHAYRWTLKPFIGMHCRHLPTCSEFALDAIDRNGAWRGAWQAMARIWRCRPGGTSGYDPAPDLGVVSQRWTPWRYGRWS